MKTPLIVATLIGLVFGTVARRSQAPPPSDARPLPTVAATRQDPSPKSEASPELSPHIHGDLTLAEIRNLPLGARRSAETSLWALSATSAEFASHWDELLASGVKDHPTLDLVISSWLRRFPEKALAHLKGTRAELRFWRILGSLDPEKGLALIDRSDEANFINLLNGMADHDPALVQSLLEENPLLRLFLAKYGLFENLFKEDPAAAFTFASEQDLSLWGHLRNWTAQEPGKAFSWALENQHLFSHQSQNRNLFPDLVAIAMEEDPEMASHTIAALPTGTLKTKLLSSQAAHLFKIDPAEALELANSHQGATRNFLRHEIAKEAANSNPALSLEILDTLAQANIDNLGKVEVAYPGGSRSIPGIKLLRQDKVISSWHQRSPAEAAAFFNSPQATPEQKTIYQNLLEKP